MSHIITELKNLSLGEVTNNDFIVVTEVTNSLGEIQTGYTIMFVVCAVAYLIAWSVMKLLVPKYSPINDL